MTVINPPSTTSLLALAPPLSGLQLVTGSGTFIWPGATSSTSATVNHNLGRVPVAFGAIGTSQAPGGNAFYIFCQNAPTTTQLILWANNIAATNIGAGTQGGFVWWAIG